MIHSSEDAQYCKTPRKGVLNVKGKMLPRIPMRWEERAQVTSRITQSGDGEHSQAKAVDNRTVGPGLIVPHWEGPPRGAWF